MGSPRSYSDQNLRKSDAMSFLSAFTQGTQKDDEGEGRMGLTFTTVEETEFETGMIRDEILPKFGERLGGECTWRRHYKEMFEQVEWKMVEETEKMAKEVGCKSKLVTCVVKLPLCFYVVCTGQSSDVLKVCEKKMQGGDQQGLKDYMDKFIRKTEAVEHAVAMYKFLNEAERAQFWVKVANLFAALRFMIARWGMTQLCRAFLEGCGGMIAAIEEEIEDINRIKEKMEASQKKWMLNAKFKRIIDERDEKVRKMEKERITVARRNEVSSSQASTLRAHIESSLGDSRRGGGTQESTSSTQGWPSQGEVQEGKKRKMEDGRR